MGPPRSAESSFARSAQAEFSSIPPWTRTASLVRPPRALALPGRGLTAGSRRPDAAPKLLSPRVSQLP